MSEMTYAPSAAVEERHQALHSADVEPSQFAAWRGLVLGLLLSTVAWVLLATAALALYKLVAP